MAKAITDITTFTSQPRWIAEPTTRQNVASFPAKLEADLFTDQDAVSVVISAAGAIATATTVPIDSFTFPTGVTKIPKGTILYFGGEKIAVLSADYTSGASISVDALPNALVDNDTATYLPYANRKRVQAGTLVGRTRTERDAGTGFGPYVSGDHEVFLTLVDTADANLNNDTTLLQNLTTVKENYIPNWATLSLVSDWLTALRANYRTIKGTN